MARSADARRTSEIPRCVAAHRRPSRTVLFVAALALGALPVPRGPAFVGPAALLAQDAGEIGAGSRVRVDAPRYGLRSTVSTVQDVGADGLLLDVGDGLMLRVEPHAMEQLEVWTGRSDHGPLGLLLGVGLGAAVGAMSGMASGDDPPCAPARSGGILPFDILSAALATACENRRKTAGEKAGDRAVAYGALAGVVGFLIGRSSTVDRWTEVDVGSTTFSVEPTVSGSGAGLVVSLPLRSP